MSAILNLKPPSENAFKEDDFLPAPELERLFSRFTSEHPDRFGFLAGVRLAIVWKKKGGKYRGSEVCGKAIKASGLAKFWGETDFTIWLAADHLDGRGDKVIANVLFHEMLHIGYDDDKARAVLVPHDLEFFFAEVQDRGLWRPELEQAHEVFTQLRLLPYEGETAAD